MVSMLINSREIGMVISSVLFYLIIYIIITYVS